MPTENNVPQWAEMLNKAVTEPGMISEAYSRFHNYSMGNQLLAMFQCAAREIPAGPLGTFMHWKENGRFVRKGEKAIMLCMPITGKRTATTKDESGNEQETEIGYTRFVFRNNWFVLSQTDGADYTPEPVPGWDEAAALASLNISRVEFTALDGNAQGYAHHRQVAVSPVAAMPAKTLFHELAHVILGHTSEGSLNDGAEITPKDIRELEAEAVAMLCCASLGLPGVEFSRGYIQSWYRGNTVPERSAQRIFTAADQILKAGRVSA
jgi:antirestriction protein ArdC